MVAGRPVIGKDHHIGQRVVGRGLPERPAMVLKAQDAPVRQEREMNADMRPGVDRRPLTGRRPVGAHGPRAARQSQRGAGELPQPASGEVVRHLGSFDP